MKKTGTLFAAVAIALSAYVGDLKINRQGEASLSAAPEAQAFARGIGRTLLRRIGRAARRAVRQARNAVQNSVNSVKSTIQQMGKKMKSLSKSMVAGLKKMGKNTAKSALRGSFYAYISANRAAYLKKGKPLTSAEKTYLKKFFPTKLINGMRVYEHPKWTGFFIYNAAATTYGTDLIIVKKGHRRNSLLKHEMVHACQYGKYGVKGFAYKYAEQYVDSGFSYRNMTFEKEAYGFAKKSGPIHNYLGYCR